jgi:AbiU2
LDQLANDFELFREECIQLRNLLNTFQSLYEGDAETNELLQKSAGLFFGDLNGWLIELLVLKLCRLTDSANSFGKDNLTVAYLVDGLRAGDKLSSKIESIAARINAHGAMLRDARNKVVAHADLASFQKQIGYGQHTREESEDFFMNLNKFTDLVGEALGQGPLDYRSQSGEGDVLDLLRALEDGQRNVE